MNRQQTGGGFGSYVMLSNKLCGKVTKARLPLRVSEDDSNTNVPPVPVVSNGQQPVQPTLTEAPKQTPVAPMPVTTVLPPARKPTRQPTASQSVPPGYQRPVTRSTTRQNSYMEAVS